MCNQRAVNDPYHTRLPPHLTGPEETMGWAWTRARRRACGGDSLISRWRCARHSWWLHLYILSRTGFVRRGFDTCYRFGGLAAVTLSAGYTRLMSSN